MKDGEHRAAMKENIVIPIRFERVKQVTRWALQTTTWLICLGLCAAGGVMAIMATMAWLVSGSDVLLALGLGGGLLSGLVGVWQLLRLLDRAVIQLRQELPPTP